MRSKKSPLEKKRAITKKKIVAQKKVALESNMPNGSINPFQILKSLMLRYKVPKNVKLFRFQELKLRKTMKNNCGIWTL